MSEKTTDQIVQEHGLLFAALLRLDELVCSDYLAFGLERIAKYEAAHDVMEALGEAFALLPRFKKRSPT